MTLEPRDTREVMGCGRDLNVGRSRYVHNSRRIVKLMGTFPPGGLWRTAFSGDSRIDVDLNDLTRVGLMGCCFYWLVKYGNKYP